MSGFGRGQVQLTETTLEKIARIFAQQYGIKVVFKNDRCVTDGKVIYLPVIPEGASVEFLEACEGYVDHEVSHCLHSDFEVMAEANAIGKKHGLLLNAFEDPRSDALMTKLWRGTKINLTNCHEWSLKQLKIRWDELTPFGKFVHACDMIGYEHTDHWFYEELVKPDVETMHMVALCDDLLERAPVLETCRDGLELAKEIMERLLEEDAPEEETKPGEKKKGKGEGDSDEDILNRGKQIQREAQDEQRKQRERHPEQDSYLIYSTERDEVEYITDGDRGAAKRFLDESRQITNSLGRKFRLNLVSETRSRWDAGKRRGKLNPRDGHKIALGTGKNVFKTQSINPGFDTVVGMLIDHSQSMHPSSIDLAAKTAMVFGENLHPLNVPFAIYGHSTGDFYDGDAVKEAASEQEKELYTRWGKMWLGVYKKFEENWPSVRHRCHRMSRHTKYNTYDAEAVRLVAQHLLRRPEKRKILFVLCDGYPCPNVQEHTNVHSAYLQTVCKEVEKVIELFAIGIGYAAVDQYYKNSVGISDLRDLPVVMLEELDRLLRRGQNAYARG